MHDFIYPLGPVHPEFIEPEFFKLTVHDGHIIDVAVYMGYNHKGVEKLVENRNWYQSIFATERICGICGHVHTSSYCMAVESLLGIQAPARANWIRALLAEMERIHNHLLWMGLAGHGIGFDELFSDCWGVRETVMDLVERISGNRVHYGINTIGGVRRDVKKEDLPRIHAGLDRLERESARIREIAKSDDRIRMRMKGIGILDPDRAVRLGIVGPVARGCGIETDVRTTGYFCYPELGFKPITHKGNDAYSRMEVRLDELLQSIRMCRAMLEGMPSGPVKVDRRFVRVDYGQSIGRVEAPRGEVVHFVVSRGDVNPYRVRVRSPTYANLIALIDMLKGAHLEDAATIIGSIDPCFSCTDRALVVDERTQEGTLTNLDELSPGHNHSHDGGHAHA